MYKKQVALSLVMCVVVAVASTLVAMLDPFQTNAAWVNGLGLIAAGIVGIFASVAIGIWAEPVTDKKYFEVKGQCVVIAGFGGAFGLMLFSSYLRPQFQSLAWTLYVVTILSFILSTLVNYLATENTVASAKGKLRSVA